MQETEEMQVWFRIGKILWRRKWQPTPVFLPGKSQGQRSLAVYSPQGLKESDTIEHAWSRHEAERIFAQLKRLVKWSLRIWILSVKRIFFKNLITCRDFQKNRLLNWPKWNFPCPACNCYFLPMWCRSSWQAGFWLKLLFIMLETTSLRLSVLRTSEKALQDTGKKLPSYTARFALF